VNGKNPIEMSVCKATNYVSYIHADPFRESRILSGFLLNLRRYTLEGKTCLSHSTDKTLNSRLCNSTKLFHLEVDRVTITSLSLGVPSSSRIALIAN